MTRDISAAAGNGDKRRRVLMAYWDGGGNVPPQRALARELIRRGHDVHVLTHNSLAEVVAADGATFHALVTAPQWDGSRPHTPGAEKEFIELHVGGSSAFAADFLALHDALYPDISVIDVMLFTTIGALAERALPYVILNHLAWNLEGRATGGLGGLAAQHTGFSFFELLDRAPMVLATTYSEFGTATTVSPHVHFVGPIREPVAEAPWPRRFPDRPFVLVSLSSVFQEQDGTLRSVCEALAPLPVEVLVTTGRGISPDILPIAGGLEARPFVPHDAVLPYVDLVVTHGGLGTAMFSAGAGAPILVLPNGRDQNDNAERVESLCLGRALSPEATPSIIAEAVARMLADTDLRANCRAFSARVRRFGDLSRAADLVVEHGCAALASSAPTELASRTTSIAV
jgi:UDP:flavonoid glycosyltransferase YjiC (YdhE family)